LLIVPVLVNVPPAAKINAPELLVIVPEFTNEQLLSSVPEFVIVPEFVVEPQVLAPLGFLSEPPGLMIIVPAFVMAPCVFMTKFEIDSVAPFDIDRLAPGFTEIPLPVPIDAVPVMVHEEPPEPPILWHAVTLAGSLFGSRIKLVAKALFGTSEKTAISDSITK